MRKFFDLCLLFCSASFFTSHGFNVPENAFSGNETPVTHADDCDWPMNQMHVAAAWELLRNKGIAKPGERITVAQLDTGIIPLPSLTQTYKLSAGMSGLQLPDENNRLPNFNFVQPDTEPWDNDPKAPSFGHGTSTASLLVGWTDSRSRGASSFRGVAPWIRLLPIKVTDSVIMVGHMPTGGTADIKNLAAGIDAAIQQGADIISVSLGALFDTERILQTTVQKALDQGIIIIAAAGQTFPVNLIPLPARLDGVIAVTASSKSGKPWKDGFTGKHIAWAAPGENICHIRAKKISSGASPADFKDTLTALVGRSGEMLTFAESMVSASGTSYSTAYTAAAAALWLQNHNRAGLIGRYGLKNISKIFSRTATRFAMDVPDDWDRNKHGAGILNIQRLIEAPLP